MAIKAKQTTDLTIPDKFNLGLLEVNRDSLNKQVEDLCKLTIAGIGDVPGYKLAVLHRASFRTTRTTLEKVRKELSAPHQEYVKNLKQVTDELGAIAFKGEQYFDEMIKAVDDEKERIKAEAAAAAQRKLQGRINSVLNYGAKFDGELYSFPYADYLYIGIEEIEAFNDEMFTAFVDEVKQAYANEQERLNNLALEEQARQEQEEQERERIRLEGERQADQAKELLDKRSRLRGKELMLLGIVIEKTQTNINFINATGHRFCDAQFLLDATDQEWDGLINTIENYVAEPYISLEEVTNEMINNQRDVDYSEVIAHAEELSKDNPTVIIEATIDVKEAIIGEVYNAMVIIGAKSDLLSIVGSWGDTLDDQEVFEMLKEWNEANKPKKPKRVKA